MSQTQNRRRRAHHRMTPALLREITEVYLSVDVQGLEAVAERFDVHRATAYRWVEKARAAGFLPVNEVVLARRNARKRREESLSLAGISLARIIHFAAAGEGENISTKAALTIAIKVIGHGWTPPLDAD